MSANINTGTQTCNAGWVGVEPPWGDIDNQRGALRTSVSVFRSIFRISKAGQRGTAYHKEEGSFERGLKGAGRVLLC